MMPPHVTPGPPPSVNLDGMANNDRSALMDEMIAQMTEKQTAHWIAQSRYRGLLARLLRETK